MGIWQDKRQRALDMIINALQRIDQWNLQHKDDPKNLDKNLLITEIIKEFEVTSRTAEEWFTDAYAMNSYQHDKMLRSEKARNDFNVN